MVELDWFYLDNLEEFEKTLYDDATLFAALKGKSTDTNFCGDFYDDDYCLVQKLIAHTNSELNITIISK